MSAVLRNNDNHEAPLQIVRKSRKNERLPFYSTAALLRGVSHKVQAIKLGPTEPEHYYPGIKASAANRAAKADQVVAGYAARIKELIAAGASRKDMDEALGVKLGYVNWMIRRTPELKALYLERTGNGGITNRWQKASENRFKANKEAILNDLKTIGLTATAKKYTFDNRTLKRFLGMK
ncbi:MAG TPA: hypothetical protein VHO48_13855 [Anaerolineaceae bacterium]|nr:hypothetical protein [Anaerolineaceae bacterium]